jgi:HSP20 family protein
MAKKPSFFARITGAANDEYDYPEESGRIQLKGSGEERHAHINTRNEDWAEAPESSGELAVDVYQTPDAIVVKALVAGVQPTSIDISLTREMLTVSGKREDEREVEEDNYFQRELFWGSFSRTILLPEEVDVDMAEASEKHGILVIRLPKINKKKEMKLKVRSR